MKNVKWSDILKQHYDSIVDSMIRLDAKNIKFQVDLYLYADGTTEEFENIGGNSWLDDDHFTVCRFNNEFNDEYDLYASEDELFDALNDNKDFYRSTLDAKIEETERDEFVFRHD